MYRVFNDTSPQYLAELCQVCPDDRLRSALHQDYVVPCSVKVTHPLDDALNCKYFGL